MFDLVNSTIVRSLAAGAVVFTTFAYVLVPMAGTLFRIALFVLVWRAAFQLAHRQTPFRLFLLMLFALDSCALVCRVCGGAADGFGFGDGALRVVLSLGFLALYWISLLP